RRSPYHNTSVTSGKSGAATTSTPDSQVPSWIPNSTNRPPQLFDSIPHGPGSNRRVLPTPLIVTGLPSRPPMSPDALLRVKSRCNGLILPQKPGIVSTSCRMDGGIGGSDAPWTKSHDVGALTGLES